ncbi:MAG: hypothetical protein QXG01_07030 [Candidatus Bathyarchaeia archaeon]
MSKRSLGIVASGQILFEVRSSSIEVDSLFDQLLNSIKSLVKFRIQKSDSYSFYGGKISHLQFFNIDREKTCVSLRFSRAKSKFLDNLIKAIINKVGKCRMNCTLKAKIDFKNLKSYLKENAKWFGELENSFSSKINIKSNEIDLVAYPGMNTVSFDCEFRRSSSPRRRAPSQIVNELLKIGGLNS